MAKWEMIAKNIRFVRHQPPADFVADMYGCSNCHNRTNNRTELPKICPWCGEDMEQNVIERDDG